MIRSETAPPINHSIREDALALVVGTSMCALGVMLLAQPGLITGQTAGLAVLLSYVSGWSFGAIFFVLNLPFYWLALTQMGLRFTLRSFIAVAMVSLMTDYMPLVLKIEHVAPPAAAFLGGTAIGLGLIAIFRHGASLGGVGVLALWLQEKAGIQAGWVQLGFDAALFAVAVFVLDTDLVIWSLAGTVMVNVIVALNHRRDRYIAR